MRTVINKLTPFYPIHPGEIIKDEIEYRGISQRQLSKQIGVSYSVLNEVLNGKRPVNTELALLIEAALNMDADTFVRMQARYNMQVARQDTKIIDRFNKITALI